MNENKKGQVTVFIIVGILIVVIAGGLIFVNRDKISFRGTTSVQVEPVREYIRECINDRLEQSLSDIRTNAGLRGISSPGASPFQEYNALVNRQGVNIASSIIGIQNIINEDIRRLLINNGCSLNDFSNQFDITEDTNQISVSTSIFDEKVIVDVVYPITITRGDSVNVLREFSVERQDDIGKVMNVVTPLITDILVARTNFDIQEICNRYDSDLSCVSSDNINGWRLIQIGDSELLNQPDTSLQRGEIFTFVIAPII